MRTAFADLLDRARAQPWSFRTLWPLRERPYLNRRVVRPRDDLVIEGFPRSANSFALAVFRVSQDPDLKIANHFHSPAQLRLAVRYGVPALLLIREPRDSVLSTMIYEDADDPRPLLARYCRFYEPLLGLSDALVVADFRTTTRDMGAVVNALNARYGPRFTPITHDAELESRSRAWLEAHDAERMRRSGVEVGSRRVALPDEQREARKAELRSRLDDPTLAPHYEAARACYDRLRAGAI